MYHELFGDASFWTFLFSVDQDLSQQCRAESCSCGGRLDCANYPRKPHGGPENLPREYRYRLSFCCAMDGCRKRKTPPLVRFLGRKGYLSAVVVLVSAMRHEPNRKRIRELTNRFGVDRQTIDSWRKFWKELIPQTRFWHVKRGEMVPGIDEAVLPLSLIDVFLRTDDVQAGWRNLLEKKKRNRLLWRGRTSGSPQPCAAGIAWERAG